MGFALSSPTTVNVRVSAYTPIHYDWAVVTADAPWGRVDGLVRILVFRDDGTVAKHSEASCTKGMCPGSRRPAPPGMDTTTFTLAILRQRTRRS